MKRYRIKSIILRNITSHKETRLELPSQGSIALVGPNGAGKSSIVEAIYAALTLGSLRGEGRGGIYELVRRSQAVGEIQLSLEAPGETATALVRLYSGKKRKEARLRVNGRLVANSDKAYRVEVARLLGVSNYDKLDKLLESSVIIPQGSLREIANRMSRPREFRELVENAVGIPDYRKALEKLAGLYLEYEGESDRVPRVSSKDPTRALQSLSRSLGGRLRRRIEEKDEAKRKIALYQEEKRRIEEELQQVAGKVESLEEKQEALRERLRSLAVEIEKLRQVQERLEEKRRRLEEILKLLDEARKAKEEIPRVKAVASLQEEVSNLRSLRENLAKLEAKAREYKALVEAAKTYNETLEAARRYDEVHEEIERVEREKAGLAAEIKAKKKELERLQKLQREAVTLLRELSRITGAPIGSVEDARAAVEGIRIEEEKVRSELDVLKGELAAIRSKREEAERALETLRRSTEAKCPVCGSPLTEEKKRRLEKELEEKIRELREKEEHLATRLALLQEKLEKLRNASKKADRIYSRVEALLDQAGPGDAEKLEKELADLTEEKRRLEEELRSLKAEAEGLAEAKKKFDAARALLESRGVDPSDYERLRREYEALMENIEELREEARRVEEKLLTATGSGSLREAERRILRAVRSLGELEEKARREPLLEEEAEALRRDIEELEEQVSELPRLKSEEERVRREFEELREELAKLREREKELVAEREGKEKLVEEYSRRLREAEEAIRRLEELRKRLVTAVVAGAILADVQERLLDNARAALEDTMTRFLEKFGLDYHAVEIDDTGKGFEVTVLSRASRVGTPVRLLSGGEQTALALAYVLALQHNLALRTGFLILDEPTSELDADRREVLMNIFQEIGGDMQLLIVTHHEDVVDKVDMVCSVRKEGDSSKVECGGL